MKFYQALQESCQQMNEMTAMTPDQRQKVAALGRVGWKIDMVEGGVVIMKKGAGVIRVTSAGEALMDSQNGDPHDMAALLLLLEAEA